MARGLPVDLVYVIGSRDHRHVKIGHSADVAARRDALQTGSPFRLEVLLTVQGGERLENALHHRFADNRREGEWFDFGERDALAEITAAIKEIRQPTVPPSRAPAEERIDSYLDERPYRLPHARILDDGLRLEGVANLEGACIKCGKEFAEQPTRIGSIFVFMDDDNRPACEDCATQDRPERQAMMRVLRDIEATFLELDDTCTANEYWDFLRAVHWGARWIWGMAQW